MVGALHSLGAVLAASAASAYLWSPGTVGRQDDLSSSSNLAMVSQEELGVLQTNMGVLERYSEKPDCFRAAARSIRLQCGEGDMDEDQRVITAITMTLCEIRTGSQHFIPLECKPFEQTNASPSASWHRHFVSGSRKAGKCVEALSRSAQFWSSYSGYLREMPQLCYAFRRWNEIDLAKDIYRNATIRSISFVQTMMGQEKKLNDTLSTWKRDLETLTTHLSLTAARVESSYASLSANLHALVDGTMLDIREQAIQILYQEQAVKEKLQDAMMNRLQTTLLAYEDRIDTSNRKFDSYAEDLQHSISTIIAASGQQVANIMDDMYSRWQQSKLLSSEIQTLSNGTIHDSRRLSRDIHMLHHRMLNLQEEQGNLLSQSAQISSKASELLSFTQNALEQINNTVIEMDDRFRKQRSRSSWGARFIWMLEKLIGFESPSANKLITIGFFNFVDTVAGLLFTTLRILVSFCMSAALIFYGVQRRLMGVHRRVPGTGGIGARVSVEAAPRGRFVLLEAKTDYGRAPVRRRSVVSRIPDRLLGRSS